MDLWENSVLHMGRMKREYCFAVFLFLRGGGVVWEQQMSKVHVPEELRA